MCAAPARGLELGRREVLFALRLVELLLLMELEEVCNGGGGVAILSNADADARMERGLASVLGGGGEVALDENRPPKND